MWQEQHTEKTTRADEPRVISKKERDAFHGTTFDAEGTAEDTKSKRVIVRRWEDLPLPVKLAVAGAGLLFGMVFLGFSGIFIVIALVAAALSWVGSFLQ